MGSDVLSTMIFDFEITMNIIGFARQLLQPNVI